MDWICTCLFMYVDFSEQNFEAMIFLSLSGIKTYRTSFTDLGGMVNT